MSGVISLSSLAVRSKVKSRLSERNNAKYFTSGFAKSPVKLSEATNAWLASL
jgi:hypothetical protein